MKQRVCHVKTLWNNTNPQKRDQTLSRSFLSLSHRDVDHREGREDDGVLVGEGVVGGGDMLGVRLRGSRGGDAGVQDNVLRR